MHEHVLGGCRPVPLAHYLKGLGVLRLVSEQVDPKARGAWRGETFVLTTSLDHPALERFFLEAYAPTPIVAPWNGGSGFYPKDNRDSVTAILASSVPRLAAYRETLSEAANVLKRLGIRDKLDKEIKGELLEACRARLPEGALPWIDAAYVLTGDGAKYPPLLGTGGNDGRLDFTNNFMQRVLDVVDPRTGQPSPSAPRLLRATLWDCHCKDLSRGAAIGQFLPGGAGGANAQSSFEADSLINPWDFILMLEGAVLFAAAAVCRLHDAGPGVLAYPFAVQQAGVGYGTAAARDESDARAEMWLPLWAEPSRSAEVRALLAEGRARVGRRPARNGVDFARAVATLGVDRGLSSFQRYGFQVRNGLSYLATPLGRMQVRRVEGASLLQEIDGWLDLFRGRCRGDSAPASVRSVARVLDAAILRLCERDDPRFVQDVLVALGRAQKALGRSFQWTRETARLPPIPTLRPTWLRSAYDGSVELRLAAALASVGGSFGHGLGYMHIRCQLEPVHTWLADGRTQVRWRDEAGRDVAWHEGNVVEAISAVLQRRLLLARNTSDRGYPDRGRLQASLGDVAAFAYGTTDDAHLADLLWGCALIDWPAMDSRLIDPGPPWPEPPALYSLLCLCLRYRGQDERPIPVVPHMHRWAAAGSAERASMLAVARLRGSGRAPALARVHLDAPRVRRVAAALAFPVSPRSLRALALKVLRPDESEPYQEGEHP